MDKCTALLERFAKSMEECGDWPDTSADLVLLRQLAKEARTMLAARVAPVLSDEDIDRILETPVPGGSAAGHWFLPHESEKALANIRAVVRAMLAAAREKTQTVEVPPVLRSALAERRRQIAVEGFTAEDDDKQTDCSLAAAAACYALLGEDDDISKLQYAGMQVWPWPLYWWRPTTYQRNLEKAIALLIAEAERVARKNAKETRNEQ